MKVHAFGVQRRAKSRPFNEALEAIRTTKNLKDRIRDIGVGAEVRCENITSNQHFWLMDFVRFRDDHGPGRVGRYKEIEGFEFDDGEVFGEQTAALYDPRTQHILIQYNHAGAKHGAIANYLSEFDRDFQDSYEFRPKFDLEVERKLQQQAITRKIRFSIDVTKVQRGDYDRGTSLSNAIGLGRQPGSDIVTVEMSMRGARHRGLNARGRKLVNDLLGLADRREHTVKRLEVSGKENEDFPVEVLDLLGHRLVLDIPIQTNEHLQYPRNARYRALRAARKQWKDHLAG